METIKFTKEEIWDLIKDVPDPEIPVITIEELGVLRDVEVKDDKVIVSITPTYSGCPAMQMFQFDIQKVLKEHDIPSEIKTVFNPPWGTESLNEEAKDKLRSYGIAPPEDGIGEELPNGKIKMVTCPHCGSKDTNVKSQFGSTACKALYTCNDCLEPFEYFKSH